MTEPRSWPEWRLMLVPSRSGVENMARDAGLMDRARNTGEAVFSVYSWARPTLSLGRNQAARGTYDVDSIAARGMDVVRRPTGGRALLHWHEVTYSVTAPVRDDSLADSYRRINRILLAALGALGIDATESLGDEPTPRPGALPCFAAPADGELIVNGAKLVGSAQYRENGALLQHGSILVRDDQHLIGEVMHSTAGDVPPAKAATLAAALGREPSVEEVASHLFAAVRALEDDDAVILGERDVEDHTTRHLDEYRNGLWTWRR